ncbi:MAG TPA: CDP-diacylglycerol--serine O-phosphatidyltransferase, partial [Polyangia bacterium]|nr:CDP-diacylglycerol--serine O-phosphatidyltransferase [Polyangia bacterium]
AVMPLLALLMVSSVRFRSFKDLRISPFNITLLLVVIGTSGLLWLWFSPSYILISLLLMYVGLGFIEAIASWPRRRRERRGPVD